MWIKLVERQRKLVFFIFNLFPESIQKILKIFYRNQVLNSVYKKLVHLEKNGNVFEGKKYNLAKMANSSSEIGVNLIGFPSKEFGLGQHLKYVAAAFKEAGIKVELYDCSYLLTRNYEHNFSQEQLPYKVNIFVCNGDAIAKLYLDLGDKFFENKYNIHYGAWELSEYPVEWIPTLSLVDEYWAMSSFLQKSVSDSALLPVLHMPYPIDFKIPNKYRRSDFGLPENKFLFIFTFDMSSVMARKNPKAVIEGFYKAFPEDKNVGLVVKVMSRDDTNSHKKELNDLLKKTKKDDRIYIIDEVLPREKMLDLINNSDVYVSLHRAEGLGIGMAEAMKMQKPVIATNYSGNTDFTLHDNSCLVNYSLIPVKSLEYIYEKGKIWADPFVDEAAFHMKTLYENKEFRDDISKKGKKYIDQNYSTTAIKNKYISRLKILGLI